MYDNNLLLNIIKNSNEIIIALDLKGKVIFWNKASQKLFGYKKEEVLGKLFPLVKNKSSYELETIISKTKEGKPLSFKTQKITKQGDEINLVFQTNPLYKNNSVIGVSIIVQQPTILKKVCYLPFHVETKQKEPKRTFTVIRDLILTTLENKKKTINQISNDSGVNWRTVEKHLTFLIGKKLISEIFSSEYVRIFELTDQGSCYVKNLKQRKYQEYLKEEYFQK